ncbi:MAG: hypothetical protein ACP5T4_01030 [Candidatus Micrarchaeia archaeon]
MKAQLSLELLIYLSLAAVSFLISAKLAVEVVAKTNGEEQAYGLMRFTDVLNAALLNGTQTISIFLPSGLCNASETSNKLLLANNTYYLIAPVDFGNSLCPSGTYAVLELSYGQHKVYARRIS